MTSVKLTIDYRTIMGQKMIDFMSAVDLGIDEIIPPPMVITFDTKSKVDKKYKERLIKELKEKFKEIIIKSVEFEVFKKL